MRVIALDDERDEAVFPRDTWKVDGEVPSADAPGILVSAGTAKLLEPTVRALGSSSK